LAPNHETNLGVDLSGDRDPVLGNLSRQIYIRLKYSHQSPAG
jgi:hypothetical protein